MENGIKQKSTSEKVKKPKNKKVIISVAVIAAVIVVAVILCVVIFRKPHRTECEILTASKDYIKSVQDKIRESDDYKYGYFESDAWLAFENNYWNSFWEEHKDCEICTANSDVPSE